MSFAGRRAERGDGKEDEGDKKGERGQEGLVAVGGAVALDETVHSSSNQLLSGRFVSI